MSFNILHLSPHLGGGVGRVLNSFLPEFNKSKEFIHEVYCLDSINESSKKLLINYGVFFEELMHTNIKVLLNKISKIDILVIHWWNHPLLYEFLVKYKLPETRVIFWSHVSGNEAPQIFTKPLFEYSNKFVFTTPISYEVREVKDYSKEIFDDVWATSDFNQVENIVIKNTETFNIGYLGTLDFSKLHNNFIKLCSKIDIPNIKFIICGDGTHLNLLKEQVKEMKLEDKFIFTGFVSDIKEYLSTFSLFGYPLSKEHYGTCDLALVEAMYCGIVPIVFNNSMESFIVDHMKSGMVVSDEDSYIKVIEKLYKDKELRDTLSLGAKKEVRNRFLISKSINKWENIFLDVLKEEKEEKIWKGKYSGIQVKPYEIYLESLGSYSSFFEENQLEKIVELFESSLSWSSKTKGTVNHYSCFFDDVRLKDLVSLNEKVSK